MRRLGLWGRPAVIIGYKNTSARTVKLLKEEWGLGYEPIAIFDNGMVPSGEESKNYSPEEVMT
jgi:hypothetical protein